LTKAIRSGNTFHPDDKLYGNVKRKISKPILDVNGNITLKTTSAKFRIDLATGACMFLTTTECYMGPEVIAKIQSFLVVWDSFMYSWKRTLRKPTIIFVHAQLMIEWDPGLIMLSPM
jgi:hypothetical protein